MVNFQLIAIDPSNQPYLPGDREYRLQVWRVIDGCLYSVSGNQGRYQMYRVGDGEPKHFDANRQTAEDYFADKPIWNGDYSVLSAEGQALAGYVSPEALAAKAATISNSINRLKAKAKKPTIISEDVEPLIEE